MTGTAAGIAGAASVSAGIGEGNRARCAVASEGNSTTIAAATAIRRSTLTADSFRGVKMGRSTATGKGESKAPPSGAFNTSPRQSGQERFGGEDGWNGQDLQN